MLAANGMTTCVESCPSDRPFVNASTRSCSDQCAAFIMDINGTKICLSECPDEKPFGHKKTLTCYQQCPFDTFVAPDVRNVNVKYCIDCHSECRRRTGSNQTCVNASSWVGACLHGCQNFREGGKCVAMCGEGKVSVTEDPVGGHDVDQTCVESRGSIQSTIQSTMQSTMQSDETSSVNNNPEAVDQ